uniref:Tripartite motif-containing protein 35-like n=1 Tax=Electrophorus electricus TaxID=8005 RepID=A0A4W4ETA1_ELEEL
MASRPSLSEEDFSCPVCCDIFRDPILLACSHTICNSCLRTFWDQRDALECPICRSVSPNANPPLNIVLRSMCEAVLRERSRRMSVEMGGLCSLHNEALSLFCVKDQRPVCDKCKDTRPHTTHSFCSIQDAAQDLKNELQMKLKPLHEKLRLYENFKQSCVDTEQHIKKQAKRAEAQIKREFEKLHHFLWDEEATRIAALRAEEMQRSQTVKKKVEKITTQISSLLDIIKAIEEETAGENLHFLLVKTQAKLYKPEKLSSVLIDVAKHLGNLSFHVSEKMHDIIHYTPVVLDPNTAHADLIVSDDLMTVVCSGERQLLPANSERIESYASVLGSEGFNSGTHWWEVEVGDNTAWAVGLKAMLLSWALRDLTQGLTGGKLRLETTQLGPWARVQLDCDKCRVTSVDSGCNTCLHIFKHAFTEKVFPYFYSHCKLHPLRIIPGKSLVTVHMHS